MMRVSRLLSTESRTPYSHEAAELFCADMVTSSRATLTSLPSTVSTTPREVISTSYCRLRSQPATSTLQAPSPMQWGVYTLP